MKPIYRKIPAYAQIVLTKPQVFVPLHAGEHRVAELVSESSCDDLDVNDSLEVFHWSCDTELGHVRLRSTGVVGPITSIGAWSRLP